jgi:hypothetical protein
VSSYSSSWRVELRRVFSCSTDRLESCHGRRGLNPTGGFTRSKKYLPTGELQRRQRRFPGAGYAFAGMRQVPIFGARSTKKEVWTMSTLSTSNWLVQPPDCPGFRMSPPLPSVPKPRNRLRVPPRARHTPSSEGVFALTCVHFAWSGPSDTGRGVCLAPRVVCLVVGQRDQGLGWWALRLLGYLALSASFPRCSWPPGWGLIYPCDEAVLMT